MKVNKEHIFTGLSIAGVLGTTVVTAIMAPKAERAIKAKICKEPIIMDGVDGSKIILDYKKADKIELVKAAAPYYIPTTLLCLFTVGMIVLSHKEHKKELLAMSAASAYLVANRNKFKEIAEKPEVKGAIKRFWYPEKKEFKHQTIETTGNGDLLCIEGFSGRIFRSSQDAVIDAEEHLIEQYIDPDCGYCSMNDFYRYLGIEETIFGWQYGWANTEEEWYPNEPIEFHNELVDAGAPGNDFGEPIYCIDIDEYWCPMQGWQEV